MNVQRRQQIEALCVTALARDGSERAAFVEKACGDDIALRHEVEALLESLLAGQPDVQAFLESVPWRQRPRPALPDGARVGRYEIVSVIGSGGMGEVYRARDVRLNRTVAIKVLPSDLSADPDRRQRFESEAKAVAGLNHPHICTLHDVGEHDGSMFLVMEHLDGETLAHRIATGQLPLTEALRIAIEIAEALSAAHAHGIIHRDLKPGNVMLTKMGAKLLDFGLAKLVETDAVGVAGQTRTAALRTEEGTIVGTVGYMSPEQAEGKAIDARSDIFSLGSVLYEMVAGRRAFEGDTRVATLAAILQSEPKPLRELAVTVPPDLERLIGRCLRKDRERRFQHMVDVQLALEDLKEESDSGRVPTPSPPLRRRNTWVPAVFALVVLTGVAVVSLLWQARERSALEPPTLTQLTSDAGLNRDPALSADGKLLAYASDRAGGENLDIWVRQIGGGEPIRLTDDPARDSEPAFSPDGTLIAFRSERGGGGIYVVSALGGPARKIASGGRPRFSPDGRLIAYHSAPVSGGASFSISGFHRMYVVPVSGGAPREVRPEFVGAAYPEWTPDGGHLLFLGNRDVKLPVDESIDWWVTPLDEGAPVRTGSLKVTMAQGLTGPMLVYPQALIPSGWHDGSLVFPARSGDSRNLWKIRISPASWQVDGRPERLTSSPAIEECPSVGASAGVASIAFASLSENSDLWSVPHDWRRPHATDSTKAQLGLRQLTSGLEADFHPATSSDGRKLVFVSARTRHQEIWIKDLQTGSDVALTANELEKYSPRFSPDGTKISFSTHRNGKWDVHIAPVSGGEPRTVCRDCGQATGWSPDGKHLIGNTVDGRLFVIEVETRRSVDLIKLTPRWFNGGTFSPDGRWITFQEVPGPVHIAAFAGATPPPESSWITLPSPGSLHYWFPDGSAIYGAARLDGFTCLWAQRLDPVSRQPIGKPAAIFHSHGARYTAFSGVARSADGIVFGRTEQTGNIWLAQWDRHP